MKSFQGWLKRYIETRQFFIPSHALGSIGQTISLVSSISSEWCQQNQPMDLTRTASLTRYSHWSGVLPEIQTLTAYGPSERSNTEPPAHHIDRFDRKHATMEINVWSFYIPHFYLLEIEVSVPLTNQIT